MKLPLDEQLDVHIKPLLSGVEVFTILDMNWLGLKNGELQQKMIENDFHFFVTEDKNLPFQQNFEKINFSIILFDTPSTRWQDQLLFVLPIQTFLNYMPKPLPKLVHISIKSFSLGKKQDVLKSLLPENQILFLEFPRI